MAQPDVRNKIVAGPLRNVSLHYKNQDYVADKVFPILPNVPSKGKIWTYNRGAWFRDEAQVRAPGAAAVRGGYDGDWVDYACMNYAFAKEVTDEDRVAARETGAPPLMPDQDAIEFCADKIDLKREYETAYLIQNSTWCGVSGEDAAGLWAPNDSSNTFIADVLARKKTIHDYTGFKPNCLLLDYGTYNALLKVDAIIDRFRYVQQGVLDKDMIKVIFDLEEVIIASAIRNTAVEAADGSDFTSQCIWEKNATKGSAFLYYKPKSPGLKTPSAGYSPRANKINGAYRLTTQYREDKYHQDVYECEEEFDVVQTGSYLGFFWYDTIVT